MNQGVGGLPYFGMILGMILSGLYIVLTEQSYVEKVAANTNVTIAEWRLPRAIAGFAPTAKAQRVLVVADEEDRVGGGMGGGRYRIEWFLSPVD
ncbi:MAG: hypothetical protein Q9175_000237 [Cornicularia normoerica]